MDKKIFITVLVLVAIVAAWAIYTFVTNTIPTPELIPTDARTPEETVANTIDILDPANPMSFLNIQDVVDLGPEGIDPLLLRANAEDDLTQWAVVVGLSALRDDANNQSVIAEQMTQYYTSDYLMVRLHAAVSNAQFGDYSGMPILIEALDSDEDMLYMMPPQKASTFALKALHNLTGEDFSNDSETWQNWWDNNELNQ